ncbi:MAG: trigger factor [Muribaculaceae bacterium]
MNVNFEKKDNVNGVITITLNEVDYSEKVNKELKLLGQKRPIKGFRPGHTPLSLLKKLYGKQILAEVVNEEIGENLTKYIHENNINILGEPMISNESKFDIENSKDFEFVFNIGIAPEFSVDLGNVSIPYYTIEVDDEMYENHSNSLRSRFGRQVPGEEATEEAVLKGSMVELNEDGTEKEGGINVESTTILSKYFKNDGEKEKFNGKKCGEEVVFNPNTAYDGNAVELASLLNLDRKDAEVKSDFKFTISEIIVNKPAELDQEYFDMALGKDAVKNEEEYKERLKADIATSLKGDSNYRFTLDAQDAILAQIGEIELPDEFLKKFFVSRDEKNTPEKMEEDYPRMRPQLIWQLAKDKIAKDAQLKVEENDLLNIAKLIVSQQFTQYGIYNAPEDLIERHAQEILQKQEYRRDISTRAVDDKIFAHIQANAKIDNKVVSVKEFNALFENK